MYVPSSMPPHGNETVAVSGNIIEPVKALILVHGRGATSSDSMGIAQHLGLSNQVLVLAPQAAHNTWYPERFIVPQQANQPELDSALDRIHTLITFLNSEFDILAKSVALAGFSQGACLVAEYVKRNPQRYLAAAIFSGGLIGDETEVVDSVVGSLFGTPIYIGCDLDDVHIPVDRVRATAQYFVQHEACVTSKLYRQLGHAIHKDGVVFLNDVLQ